MPEKSKFSDSHAKLKQRPAKQPEARQPAPPIGAEPVRGKGRPPGKRSDPDYQPRPSFCGNKPRRWPTAF